MILYGISHVEGGTAGSCHVTATYDGCVRTTSCPNAKAVNKKHKTVVYEINITAEKKNHTSVTYLLVGISFNQWYIILLTLKWWIGDQNLCGGWLEEDADYMTYGNK